MMGLDKSLFASSEVEAHEIELGDGSKHKLYFKEATAGAYARYVTALTSDDDGIKSGAAAHLVAACLCEPDGSPAITSEQVLNLRIDVSERILRKVFEINNRSKKNSSEAAKNSSGTP